MNQVSPQAKKLIIAVIIVLTILFGGFQLFNVASRQGKTKLDVFAIPGDATVVINDTDARVGTNYLAPGDYRILVSKSGFQSIDRRLTVGTESMKEDFVLTPVSEEARQWAQRNQTKYQQFESEAGQETQTEGTAFRDANPIVKFLPYRSLYFNIDYKQEGNAAVILVSANTPAGRSFAIEQIKKWGITPSNYVIKFTDLINPFSGEIS